MKISMMHDTRCTMQEVIFCIRRLRWKSKRIIIEYHVSCIMNHVS